MDRKWLAVLIGWLLGSFFGLTQILSFVGGMRAKATTPTAA